MFHVEQCGIPEDVSKKLHIYENLLRVWQSKINIVSRGTLDDVWHRHFVDSLQLVPIINEVCEKKNIIHPRVLDVGSGGGFPGMVLAIATDYTVTCVDINHKKTLFLEEVARQTGTPVEILNLRDVDVPRTDFDIITSRAYTKLPDLLQLVVDKTDNGMGVFLKGEKYQEETQKAQMSYSFSLKRFPSRTNAESVIMVVSDVHK